MSTTAVPFVVSLSNHERNDALRQVPLVLSLAKGQGERSKVSCDKVKVYVPNTLNLRQRFLTPPPGVD